MAARTGPSAQRPVSPRLRPRPAQHRDGSVDRATQPRYLRELGQIQAAVAALRGSSRAPIVLEPVEYPTPPPVDHWAEDALGAGFEARTLPLAGDDEGAVVATIVRYLPPARRPARRDFAVLYLHGWNDYFFQADLARFWHRLGGAFYALDLRKYGRSLRAHHSPGYVDDLATYDEDLEAALAVVAADHGADVPLVVMAHSTGGLTASLWAHRHPGRVAALVLNSPWLDIQGSSVLRNVSMPVLEQFARLQPKAVIPLADPGFYTRSLDVAHGGEWTLDPRWRLPASMPVRPGWLRAVMLGHAQVAAGLAIDAPILMITSARTLVGAVWSEDMRTADIVLDIELLGRRALQLGPVVTVVRVEGAIHDVISSALPARERAYAEIERWASAYVVGARGDGSAE